MKITYYPSLTDYPHRQQIKEMIRSYGEEFIPPLDQRRSTTDRQLQTHQLQNGQDEYYQSLLPQPLLVAEEAGETAGFMSFIPDHRLPLANSPITAYVSTLIVAADYRKQGLARRFYEELFQQVSEPAIATRTWSTNHGHLHLLQTLGFTNVLTIPDDRGPGLDTVYYLRKKDFS